MPRQNLAGWLTGWQAALLTSERRRYLFARFIYHDAEHLGVAWRGIVPFAPKTRQELCKHEKENLHVFQASVEYSPHLVYKASNHTIQPQPNPKYVHQIRVGLSLCYLAARLPGRQEHQECRVVFKASACYRSTLQFSLSQWLNL